MGMSLARRLKGLILRLRELELASNPVIEADKMG